MTETAATRLSEDEAKAVARSEYDRIVGEGRRPSGKELGEPATRGERWGRAFRTAMEDVGAAALHLVEPDTAAAPAPAARRQPSAAPRRQPSAAPWRQPSAAPRRQPTAVAPIVVKIAVAAAAVVAAVGFAMSFDHMRQLAAACGQGSMAWLLPVSVDGLMLTASMIILVRRRQGESAALAWAALAAGVVASIGANTAAAELDGINVWVARGVYAWPPLALALAFHLVQQLIKIDRKKKR